MDPYTFGTYVAQRKFVEKMAAGGVKGTAGLAGQIGGAVGSMLRPAVKANAPSAIAPKPSWITQNADAMATAQSKARSAVPGAVPPPPPVPTASKVTITPDDLTKIHDAGNLPSPPFAGFGRPAPYMPEALKAQDMAARPKVDLSGMFPTPRKPVTGAPVSAKPSWMIQNADAQATAMSKARSAVPGAVPPPPPVPTPLRTN